MQFTLTNSTSPATDLGFLLHKNPGNVRSVTLSYGQAHVFYPEATEDQCTVALVLEIDPIGLVRRGRGGSFALAEYVNDRPYVASSFLSVAISKLFGTALAGRSEARPDLVDASLDLSVRVPVLPSRGGEPLLHRLFEPLGYEVGATPLPLDSRFPQWGDSVYFDVRLSAPTRVRDVLGHLYVLLPVLDDQKHYWVTEDEIEKLLNRGREWLAGHPERELIARRYLRHQRRLAREALSRLLEEDQPDPDEATERHDREEGAIEERLGLSDERVASVIAALKSAGARRVLDLGCGDGRLLRGLLREGQFEEIVGVDVSAGALASAARRLRLDEMAPKQRERIRLFQGSLTYRDRRLGGYDAGVLMEVVEHIDPARLGAFERAVFAEAAPLTVVVTTPNVEYNTHFEGLPAGSLRHRDHRFEWSREEFRTWADGVASRNAYRARFFAVGREDPEVGPPTQMVVFSK